MSVEAPPPSSSFNDRAHWLCRWNWCNSSFITQTQLAHHINEAHIQTMKSVKRRDLKAILQEEPGTPSAPSLSPLERLANQATLSQSTTNSSQPPEITKPVTDTSDSTRSDALAPAEVPIQPQVPSTSLEPPPAPVGFRRFRTIGGLRGETPSPAPLPPSPDVSELIFHAAGTRNPLPPQPPASPSPSKKRPRSPTTRASISMSRSPSPTRSRRSPFPDRSVISPAPGANSTQSTNLTPFAKRLKVSRQTPPPPAVAAALLSRSKSRTPSPQRRAAISTPSPAVSQPHQTPRDPSSSPVARSAPPTTPSPASLPSEPGSSPFPEEDEDEKDDGPDTDGKPSGERAATGDLDELEEFYGTKESGGGGTQDVGDDEGEQSQSQSQSLNVKDPFGFQTQAFPQSTLGEDSY